MTEQCAYCGTFIEGGPDAWHDLRGFEGCKGGSPTSFHEVTDEDTEETT